MDQETLPSPIRYAIGDLGPARRHIARLLEGRMPPSNLAYREIRDAVERCVKRLEALELATKE